MSILRSLLPLFVFLLFQCLIFTTLPKRFNLTNCNNASTLNTDDNVKLYIITPTYVRSTQLPDMTRMAQTLMHLDNIHWLVVEDADKLNPLIEELLQRTGINHTYTAVKKTQEDIEKKVRGCSQRNSAMQWILDNRAEGVMYFADDDNAYDLRLFSELKKIKAVGILPTGNLEKTGISSPVVRKGKVIHFLDPWYAGRKFPVEMASFGVNINFWKSRGSPFFKRKAGFLETSFLEGLAISKSDLEPLADNCTKVYVWHTQTLKINDVKKKLVYIDGYDDTNIEQLAKFIVFNKS